MIEVLSFPSSSNLKFWLGWRRDDRGVIMTRLEEIEPQVIEVIWSVQNICLDPEQPQLVFHFSSKKLIFLHTRATWSELPSHISTIVQTEKKRRNQNKIFFNLKELGLHIVTPIFHFNLSIISTEINSKEAKSNL